MEKHITPPEEEKNQSQTQGAAPHPDDFYPPAPEFPEHLWPDGQNTPEYEAYIERYGAWCEKVSQLMTIKMEAEERVEKAAAERAALDKVVFGLSQTFENPPPSTFYDFPEMLDRNARILNAGFEYYLDKAAESPNADQKIRLAVQMQSQLIRTVDAWRRLENFHESKTK